MNKLLEACKKKDFTEVERLLQLGADPNVKENGVSPIHYALFYKSLKMVRTLVEYGANASEALEEAVLNGNREIVDLLLKETKPTKKALFYALKNGDLQVSRKLLKRLKLSEEDFQEALSWAVSPERSLKLLAKHASQKDLDHALCWAVRAKNIDAVRFLAQRAKDLETPLFLAVEYDFLEAVKALLDCGADLHADNDFALFIASGRKRYKIVEELVSRGARISDSLRFADNPKLLSLFFCSKNISKKKLEKFGISKKLRKSA